MSADCCCVPVQGLQPSEVPTCAACKGCDLCGSGNAEPSAIKWNRLVYARCPAALLTVPAPNKVLPGRSAVHFGMCGATKAPSGAAFKFEKRRLRWSAPSEGVWESGSPRHDDCDLTGPQMQPWKDAAPELDTACVGALPPEPWQAVATSSRWRGAVCIMCCSSHASVRL